MRRGTLVLLALLSGCNGTGSSPIANGPEPDGWIYFSVFKESRGAPLPQRIDVRTGTIETIEFPPPYDTTRPWWVFSGNISPRSGKIASLGFVGGLAPQNFVYYPAGDSIHVLRFEPEDQFSITAGFRSDWSPDGKKIALQLHRLNCCTVLALVYPASGALDTLIGPDEAPSYYFWLGSDTMVYRDPTQEGWALKSVDIDTHQIASWHVIESPADFHPPVGSPNGRWIAYWKIFDSTSSGGETEYFSSLHLLDRQDHRDTILVTQPVDGQIFPEAAFEPDDRFLAYCTSVSTITILDLEYRRLARSIEVPQCMSLAWSWGEGGDGSGS